MDDIQSWPEVPSIAHFCSLFRAAFNLLDFDIEELEEALLTDGAEEAGNTLLQDLIVRLLCGCLQNYDISTFNYQMYLRRLFRQKCQEYGRENPFNTDIDFQFLPLRVKVQILHALCDFRLDADDVPDLLRNLESDSLRVEPLGHDENKSAYWYFYGTRLYREDFPKVKKKIKERKKRRKEDKKGRRRRDESESDVDGDEPGAGVWQMAASSLEDWQALADKLSNSSCRAEQELYQTLIEDFLPEIPRLFAEKERLQKKRQEDSQPRRQSSRLGKMKQKDMRESDLHDDDGDDDDGVFSRGRSGRHRYERRSSESGWDDTSETDRGADSAGEDRRRWKGDRDSRNGGDGRPSGRQTNNSLSSATGPIVISAPKRKKHRSKQVLRTSLEDLRTGMYKIVEYVKSQEDAWPFITPVDENYAPRYYSVIRKPMDLRRMEEKLDAGEYRDLNHFRDDFQLIVDNCRQYNGSENEYTEMATNLLDAFNAAIDRYLESDPSSDEDAAGDVTSRAEPPKLRERKHAETKSTHSTKKRKKSKKNKTKDSRISSDSDNERPPPSLKPQRDRSPMSDGSVPGSDFDEKPPDFLLEKSPPRLEKARSESDSGGQPSDRRKQRRRRQRHSHINMDELNAATEETLISITRMLEDVLPPPSGFSSGANSPNPFLDDLTSESRLHVKPERPFRNERGPVRRRKPLDLLRPIKRKDIRTIERLQPGKSKGNLIVNVPKSKDHLEESGVSIGLSLGRTIKESRNALLVKTDDTGPKLSLGTVLTSDILDFGKSKHNFDLVATLDGPIGQTEESENIPTVREESPVRTPRPASPVTPLEEKYEESITNKENDPVGDKQKEKVVVTVDEKKRDGVKEITNKAAPNASAWFKAFGAPKAPTAVKKKPEVADPTPAAEEKESGWGGSGLPSAAPRRQRKVSSSSSVSEPSSLSQDSPLHPVSPGLVSPRGGGEPVMPPIPATPLRVGFYQDMSSLHKSSPEKQSPRSSHSSPREVLSNPASPFQGYSHVYPPSSPVPYANYTHPTTTVAPSPIVTPQPQGSPHSPTAPPLYENLPQYPSYTEQYRQPIRTVESYVYKPPEPTPKTNLSNFPVKKRIFANVEAARVFETNKSPTQPDVSVNRNYNETSDRFVMDSLYQQRPMTHFGAPHTHENSIITMQRMHQTQNHQTTEHTSHPAATIQPPSITTSQSDLTRLSMSTDMPRTLASQEESSRYHSEMMSCTENKPKYPLPDRGINAMLEGLGRMSSPARGFPSSLERLMPQPMNAIQEDSDGVFRNKFPTDSGYGSQIHQHQTPASSTFSTNMPHMVDRYEENRMLSNHYYDKDMHLKNFSQSNSLPTYQDTSTNPQTGFELNIPKPRETKPVQKKKKAAKTAAEAVSTPPTGFQHYVGLKPTEPSSAPPISLKTTSAVPGSAFNFGPGLSNSLYSEGYLDELRQPSYYGMVGAEKPPYLAPPARSGFPMPQFMGHQPGLVDGYQQYLQRVQEEQLRHSLAYPAGYHPALGMRPSFERPSWL